MAANAAIFVSKRLQRVALALLCILTAQMVLAVASCEPEQVSMGAAARVALNP